MRMQWDTVRTEEDVYRYLCTNLTASQTSKGSVVDIDPSGGTMFVWTPILEYANDEGLDHTLYKCDELGFCFDVRPKSLVMKPPDFPNQAISSTFSTLMQSLVDKYKHDICPPV